ncbi:ATP-binding protein [Seleniivibrio woodruffii]|uniref:sensor histidine kinase n=1 Tax=Seleniivibrio woodruffii TaxID=1078050 RepID=UPI0026EB7F75|nr:ATP-binding protein [Seleniivibrio woodruffii]
MRLTVKLIISITLVTIVIILAMINVFMESQKKILLQQAHTQAKTMFDMIVVTRQWVAENRDQIKPVPAVATKQLSTYAARMTDFRFHITSMQLINPENAPDEYEVRALGLFAQGAKEHQEIITLGEERFYRYMAPLYVNKACMECHDYQGYRIGDLRGGISVTIPMKALEKAMAVNNRNYLITGFAAFFGIVLTLTLLLRMTVLKNLSTLTDAAGSYKTGDFTKKLTIKTGDEIQELSEAFEMMRHSILENEDRLKEQLARVTEQYKTVLGVLQTRNDELKTINSFKSDILDSLAHELRTPLTKIISYSELLVAQGLDCSPDVKEKSLTTIARSARLLNTLFSEIITLSRLDSNQYPYHFMPLNIGRLVSEIAAEYEKEIADKNISFESEISDEAVVYADAESFRHVFANLISNAVKFSRGGGFIKVRLKDLGEYNVIEVEDSGVGIPADEIEKVTKRFYRATNVKREFSGTGLGLSIISRIMEGHRGRLEIESEQNKGSLFRVCVPKNLADEESAEQDA